MWETAAGLALRAGWFFAAPAAATPTRVRDGMRRGAYETFTISGRKRATVVSSTARFG
jgi:hypothetical protein